MNKKSQVKKYSENFHEFIRNLFQDNNILKSYLTQIRGFSWHNNKIKMIRSGYYSSNNFQESNKRKRNKRKNNGLSPKSVFL
jgi:hypothetical protein